MPELPTPAVRLEQLTTLYERQAYAVWNVALRTALTPAIAREASRRAFLGQVSAIDDARVASDAARLAIELATAVDSRDLDEPVLAAAAGIAPAQRAALALSELASASDAQVATALGIAAPAAHELRAGGLVQLGSLLGVDAASADAAYAELPWDEPPDELWQALYPELHAAVTRQARTLAAEAGPAAEPAVSRRRRWRPASIGIPRAALVPVALLAIAGIAWAASGGQSGTGGAGTAAGGPLGLPGTAGDTEASGGGGSASVPPHLTAEELDRLRQEEIEDLKRFTARKADKRLPPRERRRAGRKADDLVKLAQARQRGAERRELGIRRALAREREARMRERARRRARDQQEPAQAPPQEEPAPQDPPRRAQPKPRRDGDEAPAPREQDEAACLYDAETGNYICPE